MIPSRSPSRLSHSSSKPLHPSYSLCSRAVKTVTLSRAAVGGQTLDPSTDTVLVEGQDDEHAGYASMDGWHVSVPRKILPSEIGQGGRAGPPAGADEEDDEDSLFEGPLLFSPEDDEALTRDERRERARTRRRIAGAPGDEGDWVWMWKARNEFRRGLHANHSAVVRRKTCQPYSDKALRAARVVLTTSDGFQSPHADMHDVLVAVEGTDDTLTLRRGNHTLSSGMDEEDSATKVYGPVDLHSCMTLEAEEDALSDGDEDGRHERSGEVESDSPSASEDEQEGSEVSDGQGQNDFDSELEEVVGRARPGLRPGATTGAGAPRRRRGVWKLGQTDTCLYTDAAWPLLVCYQPSADVRIVALKLLHGNSLLPAYDRRITPKNAWTRCVHVTGGAVVFASCSVACRSGAGLLVEGAAADVNCVRSVFSDSAGDGVVVLDGARLQMEGCEASRNGANGLLARGEATDVRASGCRLFRNGWQGAAASAGASLRVFNSWVHHNGQAGIAAFEPGSEIRVINSDLKGNMHGISAEARARAWVSRCRLVNNVETGALSNQDGSSVSVDTCQVQGNLLGVAVRDNGHLMVMHTLLKGNKLRDSWNEAPRGRLEGVREDALVVDAVDMPGWQQQLEERDRREEAEQLRRRRRRQGLGKEDPDEMELLQADDVAVSSSLEAV